MSGISVEIAWLDEDVVALDVLLATQVENNRHQRAEFFLEVEPAALDTFSVQLSSLQLRKGESATLPGSAS